MFHWWNGDAVKTTPDANWIHEGFTEYYEGKMLYEAEIWSSAELNEHLDKLHNRKGLEFVIEGQWVPVDLVRASGDLASRGADEEYYKVYNGGALVAYFLDQELQKQGKSLDEIWHLLNDVDEPITTDVFLQKLEVLGGTELAKTCEDLIYGRRAIP
jgi:predicted metalloprotease with PDZ domain